MFLPTIITNPLTFYVSDLSLGRSSRNGRAQSQSKSEQLLTVDLLARASMKNAANCDK